MNTFERIHLRTTLLNLAYVLVLAAPIVLMMFAVPLPAHVDSPISDANQDRPFREPNSLATLS